MEKFFCLNLLDKELILYNTNLINFTPPARVFKILHLITASFGARSFRSRICFDNMFIARSLLNEDILKLLLCLYSNICEGGVTIILGNRNFQTEGQVC